MKYAKIVNEETNQCIVGVGTDDEYYENLGMTLLDVEQAKNGDWYLKGFVPARINTDFTIAENTQRQQYLIDSANERIVILQRAVKYNRATDDEKSLLEQLELFTIDVAQVDVSDVNAVFPEMP